MKNHRSRVPSWPAGFPLALLLAHSALLGGQAYGSQQGEWNWDDNDPLGWTEPLDGEVVVIEDGQTIHLNTDSHDLAGLRIEAGGALVFDSGVPGGISLTTDYIELLGTLEAGSADDDRFQGRAVITLTGQKEDAGDDARVRGILVQGGALRMFGKKLSRTWSRLDQGLQAGAQDMALEGKCAWARGDQIVLSPTGYYDLNPLSLTTHPSYDPGAVSNLRGTELLRVRTQPIVLNGLGGGAAFQLTKLDFTPAASFGRYGRLQYFDGAGMTTAPQDQASVLAMEPTAPGGVQQLSDANPVTLDERAFVGNLTRNIVIQGGEQESFTGEDQWETHGFGAHIMVARAPVELPGIGAQGVLQLDSVEIRKAGQRGFLGRYPLHWHMLSYDFRQANVPHSGDATGQFVRDCAVHQSTNRGS